MAHWIFIEEGSYPLEAAFMLTPAYTALVLENAMIEVYQDANGERRVRGRGTARNVLMVELHEDHDDFDLLLDLGDGFTFLVAKPQIMAGKVFDPDVKSLVHFVANGPLERLTPEEYEKMRARLILVTVQSR